MNPLSRLLRPLLVGCVLALTGCAHSSSTPPPADTAQSAAPAAPASRVHRLASGLVYEDLEIGSGTMADPGLLVSVHYTGWLTDGTKFDSSYDRGQPYKFPLGAGQVIRGWDEGIKGMRVGGKRKLMIPSDLAYGPDGREPKIPPDAALVFEVQLVAVE